MQKILVLLAAAVTLASAGCGSSTHRVGRSTATRTGGQVARSSQPQLPTGANSKACLLTPAQAGQAMGSPVKVIEPNYYPHSGDSWPYTCNYRNFLLSDLSSGKVKDGRINGVRAFLIGVVFGCKPGSAQAPVPTPAFFASVPGSIGSVGSYYAPVGSNGCSVGLLLNKEDSSNQTAEKLLRQIVANAANSNP
jgi:hypothetical protein